MKLWKCWLVTLWRHFLVPFICEMWNFWKPHQVFSDMDYIHFWTLDMTLMILVSKTVLYWTVTLVSKTEWIDWSWVGWYFDCVLCLKVTFNSSVFCNCCLFISYNIRIYMIEIKHKVNTMDCFQLTMIESKTKKNGS